jgi:hypothetical protein
VSLHSNSSRRLKKKNSESFSDDFVQLMTTAKKELATNDSRLFMLNKYWRQYSSILETSLQKVNYFLAVLNEREGPFAKFFCT